MVKFVPYYHRRHPWRERLIAIITVLNLGLVFFDISYLQVNDRDEVKSLANRLVEVSVYNVIPKVQPDIEDLLNRSIQMALNQIPAWQTLSYIPGFAQIPVQITEKLSKSLTSIAYNSLSNTLSDPSIAKISNRLMTNFRDGLEDELRKKHNFQEIQTLLVDLLEEFKINYVKSIQ